MVYFQKIFKELLSYNEKTQKEIAEELKLSKQTISNWKVGYSEPSIEDIKILAKYFNTTTDYLLGLENEEGIKLQDIKIHKSTNEELLLKKYRKLDNWSREKLDAIVDTFLEDETKGENIKHNEQK